MAHAQDYAKFRLEIVSILVVHEEITCLTSESKSLDGMVIVNENQESNTDE